MRPQPPPADRPVPDVHDLDEVLEQFEQAWRQGSAPSIERFLPPPSANHPARAKLLKELIRIDLEYHWRRNAVAALDQTRLEAYRERFPELAQVESLWVELIAEEYWARQHWGDRPGPGEYEKRFPQQWPLLRERLLRVDAELAAEFAVREAREESIPAVGQAAAAGLASAITSTESLLETLRQHSLLTPAQIEELGRFAEPRDLVKELVQRGWLTAYQANQLFQGRAPDLLLGPYLLLDRLGEGGAGQVFKARHRKMNRIVAVKLIRKELLTEPEVVARFYREIQVLSQLDHPNIVHAYDAGPVAGGHFLAMEYVEGTDLAKRVKQAGPMPALQACAYVRQAALGLQYAHERGLVHRDIKPHNLIMSVRDGLVKVADLGLARVPRTVNQEATAILSGVVGSGTLTPQSAVMMGTADFLAPEQALDFHAADIRADIYSLGCTLYYLLVGHPPFAGGTMAEKLLKHQQAEPPPLEQQRNDLPAGLSSVVRKMLAKRPEDRYQTPAEVAQALASPHDSARQTSGTAVPLAVPVAEPRPLAASRTSTKKKSRWSFVAASAVFLLGLAIVGIGLFSRPSGQPKTVRQLDPLPSADKVTEADLRSLQGRLHDFMTDPDPVRQKLIEVRRKHAGKPLGLQAAELIMRLPSPLDRLNADAIPVEDRFLRQPRELVAILGERRGRHWREVRSVACRAGGKVLASAGADNVIRLWDAATLREQFVLAHYQAVGAIAFSPDGKTLASVGGWGDGRVRFWDLAKTEPREEIDLGGSVACLAFAPGGKMLACGNWDGTISLVDLTDKKPKKQAVLPPGAKEAHVFGVAFAPDGKTLAAACGDKAVRLWDVNRAVQLAALTGHAHSVNSVAFAPDGKLLATGSSDATVRLWDIAGANSKERAVLKGHEKDVYSVAFTPDGKTVASGGWDKTVRLWDVATAGERQVLRGHSGEVYSLAFANDKTLVSGAQDRTVRSWDRIGSEWRERFPPKGHTHRVQALAFAPDDKALVSGGLDQTLRWWNLEKPQPHEPAVLPHNHAVKAVAFAANGLTVASATQNQVNLWRSQAAAGWVGQGGAPSVDFSPDGNTLACAGGDYNSFVRLWDLPGTPKARPDLKHATAVLPTRFAPDGKKLASGCNDGSIHLWSLELAAAKELTSLKGHTSGVTALAFAADGKTLASGGSDDVIRLWNLADPQEGTPLRGHRAPLTSLAFAPDGVSLVSASNNGQVIWWQVRDGLKLAGWDRGGVVSCVAFAGDGRHIAMANDNGTIYIFRLSAVLPRGGER